MKTTIVIAAAMLTATATPVWSQSTTGRQYVEMAGAGDLYEKSSSQLVLTSTKNPKIRSFAQMMIADHSKSTAEVKAAATRAKIIVAPPKLTAEQTRMIADLRAAKGRARDETYLTQQKAAHDKALELHTTYSSDGTVAPLKQAAAKIAPVVQHHIDMLQSM